MNYEDGKKWLERHKPKFILGACFVLVFLSGFGTGRYEKATRQYNKNQINYSTNSAKAQNQAKTGEGGDTAVLGAAAVALPSNSQSGKAATSTQASGECKIKGNIASGGKKIYHIPGGASYKIVKPEMCFNTEAEARAAGFVKSGR